MSKKLPRPHQTEAIDCIVKELKTKDRTTAVMACGTGKTLVALWVVEKMKAKTILVLLPSLALVKQTIQQWFDENSFEEFNYLVVCSDDTVVDDDSITLSKEELGFLVTTDPYEVTYFLDNNSHKTKILFSTYHSCPIFSGNLPKGFSFDIAIFDEAHKTSSAKYGSFSFALHNENISINKRVFFTATPRHHSIHKSSIKEQKPVFSMDNTDIYGEVSYKLSLREAIEKDLICDYKIIVSAITSDMINREMIQKGKISVKNKLINSGNIANLLAIQDAVGISSSKKIISFHSSIKKAQQFIESDINKYLSDFESFHINGKMDTSKRESILNNFKKDTCTIVSNSRCLTEGIDVPSIDMVAFLDPKKSKIDIIQAIGRALRKSPDKKTGYIFIPLFIEINSKETIEQALQKTDYGMLFEVIQSIKEQDIIVSRSILESKLLKNDVLKIPKELKNKIQFSAPKILIDQISNAITTQFVRSTNSSFEDYYEAMVDYKNKHGHMNIPVENNPFGWFIIERRRRYRRGTENPLHIKRLTELGFDYIPLDTTWEKNIDRLIEYKKKYGHLNVPRSEGKLGQLVCSLRKGRKNNKLPQDRIDRLTSIGFEWNHWDFLLRKFKSFVETHGRIPMRDIKTEKYPDEKYLGNWRIVQLRNYRKGVLSKEKIEKLKSINFNFGRAKKTFRNKVIVSIGESRNV